MFTASSFIPGAPVAATSQTEFKRPQDGTVIGRIDEAGKAGVDAAVISAKGAFRRHRKTPLATRVAWLKGAAKAVRSHAAELADLISEDVGKPIRMARFEANRGAEFIEACAAAAPQLKGEVLPLDAAAAGAGLIGMTRRVPFGVVAGITPFNAPANLLLQKLAPAVAAGLEASGQQCISAQRVLVDRSVLGDFLPLFVTAARALKVGPASDAATDVGPMVHAGAAERVMAMVADAVDRGATLALAPERNGATISPGILTGVTRASRLWNEEVFGPVVVVTAFDGADQAIELANDSDFGLQGAVFTRSLAHAMRFADEMEVGALWINEASRFRLDMYPFGGVKQSGIGREGVEYAMEELSQIKFIGIRPGTS